MKRLEDYDEQELFERGLVAIAIVLTLLGLCIYSSLFLRLLYLGA